MFDGFETQTYAGLNPNETKGNAWRSWQLGVMLDGSPAADLFVEAFRMEGCDLLIPIFVDEHWTAQAGN